MGDAALDVTQAIVLWALVALFVLMGINHFVPGPARVMAAMIPPRMRRRGLLSPRNLVYFTGLCEIAGGVGLLVGRTRRWVGIMLALYALCVWPANFHHALANVAIGGATLSWWYHGPRLAAQPLIIWWALWASGAINRKRA